MKQKILGFALSALLLALCASAHAQETGKIPRVGILSGPRPANLAARFEAFRQGLRELGYVEGQNVVLEWRSADGNFERLPALAAELVGLKVDVLFSPGPADTRALKEATSTIPIVMGQDTDPIGNGFVASLARPGGNITGLASLAPETEQPKKFEFVINLGAAKQIGLAIPPNVLARADKVIR